MLTNRFVICLTGILAANLVANRSANAADQVHWRSTLDQAKVEAAQSGKLVLIHFYTPNCGPCRTLEQEVFSQPQVGETIEKYFVPVKVNADVSPALASSLRIERVPSEVLLSPQGSLLATLSCPLNANAYLAQLTNFAEHHKNQAARQSNPSHAPQQSAYAGSDTSRFTNGDFTNAPVHQPSVTANQFTAPAAAGVTHNPYGNLTSPEQPAQEVPAFTQGSGTHPVVQSPQVPGNAMPNSYRPQVAEAYQNVPSHSPVPEVASHAAEQTPPTQTATSQMLDYHVNASAVTPTTNQFVTTQQHSNNPPAASANNLPPGVPPLAFDGHCPVSLRTVKKWVPGDRSCGAIHRGRTFLFVGEAERQQFFANPDSFSPVFSGMDPVLLLDEQQTVEGSRRFGYEFRGAFYLFASQETMNKFKAQPDQYAAGVRQAMNRLDSPGSETVRR